MPYALHFLVLTVAGWVNRHQEDLAVENPRWGCTRTRGALSNLGHKIARNTVKRILHDHGIDPAPERARRTPWKAFLQAHWDGLAACDTGKLLSRLDLEGHTPADRKLR